MPVYMDRHYVEGATRHAIADAHHRDLTLQDKYDVKFLTYWFDETRSTAFCLIAVECAIAIQKAFAAYNREYPLVKDHCQGTALPFSDLSELTPKGFDRAVPVYEVTWKDA